MRKFVGAVRRAVSWHRRALAVVAAVLGTMVLASLLARPEPATGWAVVTTGSIAAGAIVHADDVVRVKIPTAALPDPVVADPDAVVGRMTIAPLPRNAIMTPAAVFTPGELTASPGMAIMPVRLQESGLKGLLTVGARVDLIGFSSATGNAEVLARNVRIVAIPAPADPGAFGAGGDEGLLVIIEVPPDTASSLTTASAASSLNVIIR